MSQKSPVNGFKSLIIPAFIPIVFVLVMWLVKIAETLLNQNFSEWGIFPQTLLGLRGILFSPFIHGGWSHLMSNTLPLILLGFGLFHFYRNNAWGFWLLFISFLEFSLGLSVVSRIISVQAALYMGWPFFCSSVRLFAGNNE